VRAEPVAGAGAPALAGEDRGDLLVGILLGELAPEVDGVLVGAAGVAAGPWQRHGVLGDLVALPRDPQLGCVLLGAAVDGHDHVGEDRAQQLLALAVGLPPLWDTPALRSKDLGKGGFHAKDTTAIPR
jgi:hypothetical protein